MFLLSPIRKPLFSILGVFSKMRIHRAGCGSLVAPRRCREVGNHMIKGLKPCFEVFSGGSRIFVAMAAILCGVASVQDARGATISGDGVATVTLKPTILRVACNSRAATRPWPPRWGNSRTAAGRLLRRSSRSTPRPARLLSAIRPSPTTRHVDRGTPLRPAFRPLRHRTPKLPLKRSPLWRRFRRTGRWRPTGRRRSCWLRNR